MVWKIIFLWGFSVSCLMLVYVTYISQLMLNRSLSYCRMSDRFWQNVVDVNNIFVISKLFSIFSFWNFLYGCGDLQGSTARIMPQINFYLYYQIETWIKSRNQQDYFLKLSSVTLWHLITDQWWFTCPLPRPLPSKTADEHSPILHGHFLIECLLKITTSRIVSCSGNSKRCSHWALTLTLNFLEISFLDIPTLLVCCVFFSDSQHRPQTFPTIIIPTNKITPGHLDNNIEFESFLFSVCTLWKRPTKKFHHFYHPS